MYEIDHHSRAGSLKDVDRMRPASCDCHYYFALQILEVVTRLYVFQSSVDGNGWMQSKLKNPSEKQEPVQPDPEEDPVNSQSEYTSSQEERLQQVPWVIGRDW